MEEEILTVPEVEVPDEPRDVEVVDVQFRPGQKVYFFDPAGGTYQTGDHLIIETARVLFFQMIDHLFYHPLGRENLIGLLRRNVVENVFFVGFIKIVRQHPAESHEFPDRIIEYNRIE